MKRTKELQKQIRTLKDCTSNEIKAILLGKTQAVTSKLNASFINKEIMGAEAELQVLKKEVYKQNVKVYSLVL